MSDRRFRREWDRLVQSTGVAAGFVLDLEARHRERQRHYHTVEHVEAVIEHLDTLDARSPVTMLAAFFHDAVYDPARSDNEARSAELAARVLGASVERDDVVAIILATAGHSLPADAPAGAAAFLDADLAILGADDETYRWYAEAIRAEYSHMSTADFRHGRASVLAGFLERDRLFFTDAGHDRWEASARANLAREIAGLIAT